MEKKTRKEYEEYLNEISPSFESDEWIIGGKRRNVYARKNKWGTCMRVHDPIAFTVGFNEYDRNR